MMIVDNGADLNSTQLRPKLALLESHRAISVSGIDATQFLQNLITADLSGENTPPLIYGGLLSPQGKLQFDFLAFAAAPSYRIDLPEAFAAQCARRLSMYKLRAKINIGQPETNLASLALWGAEPGLLADIALQAGFHADPRLAGAGWRALATPEQVASLRQNDALDWVPEAHYHAHRIAICQPELGRDFQPGEQFAHDVNMDWLNGLSLTKGCFVGQEIVSRMHHRGTARRRIVRIRAVGPLQAGSEICVGGRPVGFVGTADACIALALVRIDRIATALKTGHSIVCQGQEIEIDLPELAQPAS